MKVGSYSESYCESDSSGELDHVGGGLEEGKRRSSMKSRYDRRDVLRKGCLESVSGRPERKQSVVESEIDKFSVKDLKDAWRREFKIKGQIGKIGDRENKLDFISLNRQIKAAQSKGYSDLDITEAVINSTTAGSNLRALLQSMRGLTVDRLMEILRSYFQELDEGDLLQQLATAQQGSLEDPQTYVIRVLALKNRILMESEQGEAGINENSLNKIMHKSLETGIWSENIRNRIRPVLSSSNVTDTAIMREISLAVQSEKTRKEKFASKRQLRVSMLLDGDKVDSEKEQNSHKRDDKLLKVIDEMRGEINELKLKRRELSVEKQNGCDVEDEKEQNLQGCDDKLLKVIDELKGEISELKARGGYAAKQYGCGACKKDGTAKMCNHCFRCGETTHQMRDCPAKNLKPDSLNPTRPLTKGDSR